LLVDHFHRRSSFSRIHLAVTSRTTATGPSTFPYPFQTVKRAAREMGMAFTTVQRAMEKLESLSVVSEVSGGKRDRVYCAKALMEILEEPAKLAP
jgi:ABC-type lipoprotein export system ATPase subunit